MRYFVHLDASPDAQPIAVDITELPSGALDVRVNGRRVDDVDVAFVGSHGVESRGALSVRVEGRMVDLTTEGSLPELGAVASGHRSYVRVESERHRAANAARGSGVGATDKVIKSPMPGRVVRLLVAAREQVAAGQTLCVIEAMKMENEVKAKADCVVETVHVSEGATVEAGGKLITFA